MPPQPTAFRLSDEVLAMLRALADADDRSQRAVVERLIRDEYRRRGLHKPTTPMLQSSPGIASEPSHRHTQVHTQPAAPEHPAPSALPDDDPLLGATAFEV